MLFSLSLWERAGVRVFSLAAGLIIGLPLSALAQDIEPAAFIPDAEVRPIAVQVTDAEPAARSTLRWKSKPATVTNVAVTEAAPLPAPKWRPLPLPRLAAGT